ncbi:hypothetical protein BDQ12DRAFT_726975 [Crucibulum laeve]|uniref:Yeast cell wall synthesis Kre9/Knh1-like N-terminal domain-containing protein n=1 Tax=Crucibulum laeve TaxID=68775 RepID=A0A5C3LQP3_9AGAR|nr:hypothetical protein BDQ12DRAFT_726975 [Crucibulum laeve]
MRFVSVAVAAICALPLVSAITLQVPTNPHAGGVTDINWTVSPTDPSTWILILVNTAVTNSLYQAWHPPTQINPSSGHLQTALISWIPVGAHYQLRAVKIDNIWEILAYSPEFSFV